ncbi:unnamed protein product [Phytomonas sp. EM1]|nr:unnamed protein product [Phytomonas sp. EM1]|eukprot:CCW65481.1 unnamed protein product [Phytomonas sp. isolate EM1]
MESSKKRTKVSRLAAETFAALDAMEENMRELGIGHNGAEDPVKGDYIDGRCSTYMKKIRARKDEQQKLRAERILREFMAGAQSGDDNDRQGPIEDVERTKVNRLLEQATTLLKTERVDAHRVVELRLAEELKQQLRSEQIHKYRTLDQNFETIPMPPHMEGEKVATTCVIPPAIDCETADARKVSNDKFVRRCSSPTQSTEEHCRALAKGLVELAFCVSNNRFLSAEDINGRPVRRLVQDLPVTTWRTWVRKYLWGLEDEAGQSRGHPGQGSEHSVPDIPLLDAKSPSVSEPLSPQGSKLRGEEGRNVAHEHLVFAAEQMGSHLSDIQAKAVEESLEGLRVEEERLRRSLLDDIRRRFDESQRATEDGGALGSRTGTAADTVSNATVVQNCSPSTLRKEIIPGWMHRMPPAGCFVFGDDLSGVCLCADNIDRIYTASVSNSSPIRRPSQVWGTTEDLSSSLSIHNAGTPLGHTSLGVSKVEDGYQKVFLTPRIFQAAGRTSFTSRNRLGIANIANLRNILRRTSLHTFEEDDHRELDTMADQLCHELVNTHLHNLHVLTSGLVPPIRWTLGSPCQVKEQPHGNTPPATPIDESNASGDPMPPLRCLFLFNFPNCVPFYRLLQQKLQTALESAELFVQRAVRRQSQNCLAEFNPISSPVPAVLLRGSGNYGGGKMRSTSVSTSHASLQRSKGVRAGSGRGKGIRTTMSLAMVDSNSRDDNTTTDGSPVVLPPLCVLGFFVEYNLPTRQRRLQEAYFHLPDTSGGRNSDGTADTVSSSNTGVSSQPIYHNTFRPELPVTGLSSKEANVISPMRITLPLSGGISPQTLDPKVCNNPTSLAVSSNGGVSFKKSRTVRVQDWSASCLRRELLVEDMNMKRWQEDWKNAFEPATSTVASEPTLTTTTQVGRGTNSNPLHSHSKQSSKKKATNASQSTNDGSGVSTSLQNDHEKLNLAAQGTPDGNECGNTAEAAITAVNFPRVLFFFRKEEFNFSAVPSKNDSNGELDGTLWAEGIKSPPSHPHESTEERMKSCEYLISRVTETVRNSSFSDKLFTNESLCPHQLPTPLRLSDYRLPSLACGELVQAYRTQSSTYPTLPLPSEHKAVDEVTRIDAFQAEVSVFGCLIRFLTRLLHLLRDTAFLRLLCCEKVDDKLKQTATLTSTRTCGNSKTIYYSTVDRSFQEAQTIAKATVDEYRQELMAACCIWLERQLLIGLETTVGGLEMMISDLKRRHTGGLMASTAEKESCAAPSLLKVLPTPSRDKLNELISRMILAATPSAASDIFWSGLDEYFKDVEDAAIACVLESVTSGAVAKVGNEAFASGDLSVELLNSTTLDAFVPTMVKELLARLFALPQVEQTTSQGPSLISFHRSEQAPVSTYIARCGDLICEVLFCFNMGMSGSFDWLQGMYQAAINRPNDGTCPVLGRPRTMPDIFLPPFPNNICGIESEKVKSLSTLNAWTHLNMKLFVTSFSIFGRSMLKENEFLYANVLTQLARIEQLLVSTNRAASGSNNKNERQGDGTAMKTSCSHYWLDSFLLNAPCRAKLTTPLSFLSLEEMRYLFKQASKVPSEESILALTEGNGLEPKILASARHFITSLALRRWCFCSPEDLKGGYPCSLDLVIPEPTTRELRAAIMTLPAQLCGQGLEAASIADASKFHGVDTEAAWQSVRWWWLKSPITQLADDTTNEWVWILENEDIPLILLYILRSDFVLTRATSKDGYCCPAYPPLRRILKLLTRVAHSKMATIERTFHTIAALQSRQHIALRNINRTSIDTEGGTTPPPAMAVDDLELSVETFCEFFSNGSEATKVPLSLACDVHLMLQWEGAQAVTLPLLLSSHWGRLLLANHALD